MRSPTCSTSSARAGEPLAGTAVASTWRWLGVEYRGAWPSRAEEVPWPTPVGAWLDRFRAAPGTRVQLLRRPERRGPPAAVFADTTPGAERAWQLPLADLVALDSDDVLGGEASATPLGPSAWVCTHGQRDVCCARHGGRVFAALRERLDDAVWQTSHLGGHRFAATLLWLPEGLSYGRLRPAEAPALAEAALAGRVHDLQRLRGRTAWSRPVQAAEIALRRHLGLHDLAAPALVAEEVDAEHARIAFEVDGTRHEVLLERRELAQPVIASCAKAPAATSAWYAL